MGRSERAVSRPIIIGRYQEPVAMFAGSLRLAIWPKSLIIAKVGACIPFGVPNHVSATLVKSELAGRLPNLSSNARLS